MAKVQSAQQLLKKHFIIKWRLILQGMAVLSPWALTDYFKLKPELSCLDFFFQTGSDTSLTHASFLYPLEQSETNTKECWMQFVTLFTAITAFKNYRSAEDYKSRNEREKRQHFTQSLLHIKGRTQKWPKAHLPLWVWGHFRGRLFLCMRQCHSKRL